MGYIIERLARGRKRSAQFILQIIKIKGRIGEQQQENKNATAYLANTHTHIHLQKN